MDDNKPKVEVVDTVGDLAAVAARAQAVVAAYRESGPYNQKGRTALAWAITALENALDAVGKPKEVAR